MARRFGLLDAMILIAATAVALALIPRGWPDWGINESLLKSRVTFFNVMRYVIGGPIAFLASIWTLALIPLRLRSPRPRRIRLMRQPGMAVGVAVGVMFALSAYTATIGLLKPFAPFPSLMHWWGGIQLRIPFAVAGAWLGLILAGRWRAEAGWIDRLGRVLGIFWIAQIMLVDQFAVWTYRLFDLIAQGLGA
jgi:hypothetical protein